MNKSEFVGLIFLDCITLLKNLKYLEARENSRFRSLVEESVEKLKLENY